MNHNQRVMAAATVALILPVVGLLLVLHAPVWGVVISTFPGAATGAYATWDLR